MYTYHDTSIPDTWWHVWIYKKNARNILYVSGGRLGSDYVIEKLRNAHTEQIH